MLELNEAIKEIKKSKAKKVLIQLPDGLKPKATSIVEALEKKTGCKCFVWGGSCWGACDVPDAKGFDLVLHFGHNKFGFWE